MKKTKIEQKVGKGNGRGVTLRAPVKGAVFHRGVAGHVVKQPTVLEDGKDPQDFSPRFTQQPMGEVKTSSMVTVGLNRLYTNCIYPFQITFNDYWFMYNRNNVAARVIETYPNYCWRVMPVITDNSEASKRGIVNKTRFEKSVNDVLNSRIGFFGNNKMSFYDMMRTLDILGGIGGEALLVMGFDDGKDLSEPVQPLNNGVRTRKVKWCRVLHRGEFDVNEWDEDQQSVNYGNIKSFVTRMFIDPLESNCRQSIAPGTVIHMSRCVHFVDSPGLPYGISRIKSCFNQLIDIAKLSGAAAEVYWLGAFSGMSIESKDDAGISDDAYEKMKLEIEKYFEGLSRSLVIDGASAKLLYPAIVSPKDSFDTQLTMITIATGIPRRFLTGAEAAKLASQQDTMNWEERVTQRRDKLCTSNIVVPLIDTLIKNGVISPPKNGEYKVLWQTMQINTINDRSRASGYMTTAWIEYIHSGLFKVVPFHDYLMYVCGYTETEAEDIVARVDENDFQRIYDEYLKTQTNFGAKVNGGDDDSESDDDSGSDDE